MCPKEKARPIAELLPTMKLPSRCTARMKGKDLIVEYETDAWEEPIDIGVALLTEPYVLAEAVELAEEHGEGRPDQAAIATYDARYQIVSSLSLFEHTFEVMWILASRFAKPCEGVIFNMTTQEWVDPF